MDLKNFTSAISQIAEEKGISKEKVIETIESAIAAAYKKDYAERGQIIKAKLSPESGGVEFWRSRQVLDDSMIYTEKELEDLKEGKIEAIEGKVRFNPEKHIMIEEAKKKDKKIKVGDDLEEKLEPKGDYGRIAAQTAKQVIMQKIREAEKETVLNEYKDKEGEIVSGIVQRIEGRNIYFDIGRTLGILTKEEQIPQEFYRPGQRLKLYILRVEENPKGPLVFLSRAYPKFISKLFELEVPEISSGTVEIKSIAREAGSRTKIAVYSNQEGVDPIGSLVGQRGTRISAVINELGGEKIDAIEFSEDSKEYISNSLSPANVVEVKILEKNKALALVPNDQLSLAIGKDGQNVRLAAKLTGWKIDVRSPEQQEEMEEESESETETETEEEKEEKLKKEKKEDTEKTKKKRKKLKKNN
jgi:N utilization substance protein A